MPIDKPTYKLTDEYKQLALSIDVESGESDGITPEEARRRSETARYALENLRGSEGAPGWLEDVFRLIDGDWPWRQATYIAWASSPKLNRHPKTQEELAVKYLGLNSDRVISTWRKRNPEIDNLIGLLQSASIWDSRADDFKALEEGAARAGDDYKFFPHLKLKLEMRGDYVPKSELEAFFKRKSSGSLESKRVEELRQIAAYDDDEPQAEDEGE